MWVMDSRPEQFLSEERVEKCVEGSLRTEKFYFLFDKTLRLAFQLRSRLTQGERKK